MSAPVAKSGWLFRQSNVLKKWKRNWFVLTQDGYLRYFLTEFSTRAEDAILMPVQCTAVRTGPELNNGRTPEGLSDKFLLSVETTSGAKWIMCAESEDDMRAWELSLHQARIISHIGRPSSAPPAGMQLYEPAPPYTVADDLSTRYVYGYPVQNVAYAYPGQVYYGSSPPTQIVHVPGNTVVYRRHPYSSCYPGTGLGLGTGMLAGAALGSMMWAPMLWW